MTINITKLNLLQKYQVQNYFIHFAYRKHMDSEFGFNFFFINNKWIIYERENESRNENFYTWNGEGNVEKEVLILALQIYK